MRRNPRALLGTALLLLAALPAVGQNLFWERPVELVSGGRIRHSSSASGGGLLALAWQEIAPRGSAVEEGTITLAVATSRDGKTWSRPNRGLYPAISYKGLSAGIEPRVYSMSVDRRGTILVAVTRAERGIAVLQSTDDGQRFAQAALLAGSEVLVAPSLFASAAGGFILLASRASSPLGGDPIELVASSSRDGRTWAEFRPLVGAEEPGAGLQLQPDHAAWQGRDYVVFQSQDARLAYQLYIKESVDGGATWSQARPITTREQFSGTVGGTSYGPGEFSNQRPRLTALEGGLGLSWERNLLGDSRPQVFFCTLDATAAPVGAIEQVTTGTSAVFARIVPFRTRLFMLYTDSFAGGSRVTLAEKRRTWEAQVLDRLGTSRFPHAAVLGDSLYFFWERDEGGTTSLVDLSPDTSVARPAAAAADPAAGSITRQSAASVRWRPVDDSSGVREYRYRWSLLAAGKETVQRAGVVRAGSGAELASSIDLGQDGTWSFTVTAVDTAANVSPPLTVSFVRDTAAPGPVVFADMAAGTINALSSNDVTVSWTSRDADVVSYRWERQKLAGNLEEYAAAQPEVRPPPPLQSTQTPRRVFPNLENGVWAFTVQAVDAAGNAGPASTVLALLGNYVPLAEVWSVIQDGDELGGVTLSIRGKGFLTAGRVEKVVLDEDGRAPYDLAFAPGEAGFSIGSDGRITGPRLTNDTPPGRYRVGIVHPTRGSEPWFFPGFVVGFKSPGTVKIGNFELPLPDWIAGTVPSFTLGADAVLVVVVVAFLVVLVLLAGRRVAALAHEGALVTAEIAALIEDRPSRGMVERKRRMKELRRKGAGLRLKFTLLVVVLVILVVLIVSVPLGYQMTNNQQSILATGLAKQSEILAGSLASAATAQIKLRDQGYADVAEVPKLRNAMAEALYATVSGPSSDAAANSDPDRARDFVWASDEKRWVDRRDAGSFRPATEPVADAMATEGLALAFQKEIDGTLSRALEPLVAQYKDTLALVRALSGKTDRDSIRRYNEAFAALAPKRAEIDRSLAEQLAGMKPFRSYPDFSIRTPVDTYVFYYPVVYFAPDDPFFYHGMVRLAVGTATIRQAITRAQLDLLRIAGLIALLAVALGVVGAIILASIVVTPIRRLVKGVAVIRDTDDKEQLKAHSISVGTRDEIGLLAETVNEMTQGLVKAAIANKMLLVGKEIQKMFLPLEKDAQGRKLSTASENTPLVEIYGYNEGAKVVSGDYFDYRKLDDTHYAFIKCDVSGKGVSAALIMVEVATLFISYFRDWEKRKQNISGLADPTSRQKAAAALERVDPLVYTINDMLEERGFKGMFAAFTVGVLNLETGVVTLSIAGDRELHRYVAAQRRIVVKTLPEVPAAGIFPSMMVDMKSGFPQFKEKLDRGDALFLLTDGFDEGRRLFRTADLEVVPCQAAEVGEGEKHLGTHAKGQNYEDFGMERFNAVVDAVFSRGRYQLVRHHLPVPEEMVFDFSGCEGTVREAVLAVVGVEKVFRSIPDPNAGPEQRITVDSSVDEFLQQHFVQYSRHFEHKAEAPAGGYVTFTHAREDEQYDDLTILVIRRK